MAVMTVPVIAGMPTQEACTACGAVTELRQHERREGILMVLCTEFRSCNKRARDGE